MTDIDHQPPETLDLRDYLRVLRRRRGIIIATVIVVVAVAMAITYMETPTYEAQVRVVPERFEDLSTSTDAVLQEWMFGFSEMETQREIVASEPVAQIVLDEIGLDRTPSEILGAIDVTVVGESQVLEIRASSPDPQLAAGLAQGFADAYLQYRRDQALERTLSTVNRLQQRARQIRETLEEVVGDQRGARGAEADALEQEESALLGQLGSVQAQIVSLSGGGMPSAGGEIIRPATVPQSPASPRPGRTAALALVLGAMLGVGLAFFRDFLDDSIRNDDDVRRATGRPVLAHIPNWKNASTEGPEGLAAYVAPTSVVGESYQTLHTNVRFMAVSRELKSLLVTSASSGDGKTTTAANMAVAAARSGRQVLLVGVDFRRPKLADVFGLKPVGLSEFLAGEVSDISNVVQRVDMPNLLVVPSGAVPPNPAELLNSAAMAQTMARFEEIADLVIYDGPPVLPVADALELGPRLGGTLIVVNAGRSGRHGVRAAVERLRSVGAEVVGVVLNNIPHGKDTGYHYYAEYYGEHPDGAASNGAKLSRRQRRRQKKAGAEVSKSS